MLHNQCVFENLDLFSRNFNIWQSVVFLFTFLVRASELVPVLFQIIEQIEINDVIAVMAAIDEFYIILQDPELYSRESGYHSSRCSLDYPSCSGSYCCGSERICTYWSSGFSKN
jgi:hypothetical protein